MKSSFFVDLVCSFRTSLSALRRRRAQDDAPRRAEGEKRVPPRLEPLEDRCVPSVTTTTVPSLSEISPIVALPDILSATMPKGNPSVVFLGDSISWEYIYGTGSSVWNAYMAPLGMANFGVYGQTTQSLLYQLSLGVLTGVNPAEVVLDIGANDLLQGNSPQDTAEGVLADVAMIHQFLPQTQILVLGVFPGMQYPNNPYRGEGVQTNQLVSQMLASDPKTAFADIGGIFVQADGTISNSMMFDYLHPTTLGYLDLTNVLMPVMQQALFPGLYAGSPSGTPSFSLSGLSLRSFVFPSANLGAPVAISPS